MAFSWRLLLVLHICIGYQQKSFSTIEIIIAVLTQSDILCQMICLQLLLVGFLNNLFCYLRGFCRNDLVARTAHWF